MASEMWYGKVDIRDKIGICFKIPINSGRKRLFAGTFFWQKAFSAPIFKIVYDTHGKRRWASYAIRRIHLRKTTPGKYFCFNIRWAWNLPQWRVHKSLWKHSWRLFDLSRSYNENQKTGLTTFTSILFIDTLSSIQQKIL